MAYAALNGTCKSVVFQKNSHGILWNYVHIEGLETDDSVVPFK